MKAFENRLDKYWSKYKIKYNSDRCNRFEKLKAAGLGTINMIEVDIRRNEDDVDPNLDEDLDQQAG